MSNELKQREELQRLYSLATSDIYRQIKEEFTKHIIKASTSSLSAEKIQGMLMLLNLPEIWISNYFQELEKRHKNA